ETCCRLRAGCGPAPAERLPAPRLHAIMQSGLAVMMPGCVMAARRTLDPSVQVRILARQPQTLWEIPRYCRISQHIAPASLARGPLGTVKQHFTVFFSHE